MRVEVGACGALWGQVDLVGESSLVAPPSGEGAGFGAATGAARAMWRVPEITARNEGSFVMLCWW
jgi:hypothetical protein